VNISVLLISIAINLVLLGVLVILGIPIHELSHLVFIKMVGGRNIKGKITWFGRYYKEKRLFVKAGKRSWAVDIGIRAGGELEADFPGFWYKREKILSFLIGFSGGFGVTLLCVGIGLLLFINRPSNESLSLICVPFFLEAVWQFQYSIREGIKNRKRGMKMVLL
jgi:hypothetical protein